MTSQQPSSESLYIGMAIESILGVIACSAIFSSPIHWTLKVGFAATLLLIIFTLDSQEASNEWGRELQTILIAAVADGIDSKLAHPQDRSVLQSATLLVSERRHEILRGGGSAEWRLIVFQLRAGTWLTAGLAFSHFLAPSLLRTFP